MKSTIQVIILLAIAALCGGCAPTLEEDSHKTEGTVTLTLNSPDTNGLMGEDGNVTWSQNDYVHINGKGYPVTLDAEDPTIAYVENVEESDCYYATHNSGHQLEEYCNWENGIDLLVPRVQNVGALNLPLIAYSETTDLHFKHTSGILRVGVTGNGNKIKSLRLTAESEIIAGLQHFSCENIRTNNLTPEKASELDLSTHAWYVTLDAKNEITLENTPQYFDFVLNPGTYNFALLMIDTDNNISYIRAAQPITISRGSIKKMEPCNWTPITPIEVEITNPDSIQKEVEFFVNCPEWMTHKCIVVSKMLWDSYISSFEDESQLIHRILFQLGTVGVDLGPGSDKIHYQINTMGAMMELDSDTEYKLIVSYGWALDGVKEIYDTQNAAVIDFKTKEAPCTITPKYQVGEATTDGYRMYLNIKADSLTVSRLEFAWGLKSNFDELKTKYTLDEIVSMYGFDQTLGIPEYYGKENGHTVQYSALEYDTEYIWLIRFIGPDGMRKIETRTVRIPPAIQPERYTWNTYSENAYLKNNLFVSLGINEHNLGVAVEKAEEEDIFRIRNPFHGQSRLLDLNFTEDEGDYYIYIDARNPDDVILPWKMNFTGIHFPETWLPESSMHIGSAITYSNQENNERAVWNKEQKYINFGTTLILANATGGYYSGATILYFNL